MKLILQQLGTVWLIGIETSDAEELQQTYHSLWNHGATSADLHEMSDCFSYIVSDEERVKQYFLNSSLHIVLNKFPDAYKGFEGGAMPHAKSLAKHRLEELMENQEAFVSTNPIVYDYSIGRIEPRENPSRSKVFDEEEWKSRAVLQRSSLESA
jgi:hypothetical protein